MNGTKMKKHAVAVLLLSSTMVMASCNHSNPDSSSVVDSSVSSSEYPISTVDGVIRFSDTRPSDFEIGTTTNLEDYITVTVADSWRIETKDTKVVEIKGHNVKALSYGDFTLTIIAGRTRRAYRGHVVTKEKIEFNQLMDSFSNNYRATLLAPASTTSVGLYADYLHTKNYYASLTETASTYAGTIKDKNGRGHSFTAKVNSSGVFSSVTINPGYVHVDDTLFSSWTIRGEDFSEAVTEDADGNPTSTIYLADAVDSNSLTDSTYLEEIVASTGFSFNLISQLASSTFLGNGGSFTDIVAEYDTENRAIIFVYTDSTHALPGKNQAYVAVQLSMPGAVSIDAVQKVYDNDGYPAALSASPVATLTNEMSNTKKYHVKSVGSWVDPNGTTYSCPSKFQYGDTGTDIFWNFDADAYVDGEAYYERINAISTNVYQNDALNLKPNAVNAYVLHNGSIYQGRGSYTNSADVWDSSKTAVYTDAGKSIWTDKLVLTSAGMTEEALGTLNVLSASDDGKTYTFNDIDTAQKSGTNAFFLTLLTFGPTHSGNTFWRLISHEGLESLLESSMVYDATAKTLTYTAKLSEIARVTSGNNRVYLSYQLVTTIDGVGTDNLASTIEAELFPATDSSSSSSSSAA